MNRACGMASIADRESLAIWQGSLAPQTIVVSSLLGKE